MILFSISEGERGIGTGEQKKAKEPTVVAYASKYPFAFTKGDGRRTYPVPQCTCTPIPLWGTGYVRRLSPLVKAKGYRGTGASYLRFPKAKG